MGRRDAREWLAALEDKQRRKSWRYRDLEAALRSVSAVMVSKKGSHRTFKHGDHPRLVTLVDAGNDTLSIGYVNDVVKLLSAALGAAPHEDT